eukprot:jgi/Chlat1/3313/Chrsp22S03479
MTEMEVEAATAVPATTAGAGAGAGAGGSKKNNKGPPAGLTDPEIAAAVEAARDLGLSKGQLPEALEKLLAVEKHARLAGEITATRTVVVAIVRLCFDAKDYKALNEHIVLLSKRRAQLKQAVVAMVQEATGWVDQLPSVDDQVALIETLNSVTTGKMYVEIERARLTRRLVKIKEDQGKLDEAADIMQDVAVETFSAMAKTERIAFILEQVRLCLDRKDPVRASILAKKINPQVFEEKPVKAEKKDEKPKPKAEGDEVIQAPSPDTPSMTQLKLIYYQHMIRYYTHEGDYLELCRAYQHIFDTSTVRDDPNQWMPVLKRMAWYVVLAPHGPMQISLLNQLSQEKKLSDLPKFQALLKVFITMEVVNWPAFLKTYQEEFASEPELFKGGEESKAMKDLRLRITQHNILVVSKYYTRITTKRLAALMDLPMEDAERHLADMVVSKALVAKVDRPAGIVSFRPLQESTELLNDWSSHIGRLLSLVERSCHQIHKETMIHKVTLA